MALTADEAAAKANIHLLGTATSISASAADDILNGLGINPRGYYAADAESVSIKDLLLGILLAEKIEEKRLANQ